MERQSLAMERQSLAMERQSLAMERQSLRGSAYPGWSLGTRHFTITFTPSH